MDLRILERQRNAVEERRQHALGLGAEVPGVEIGHEQQRRRRLAELDGAHL